LVSSFEIRASSLPAGGEEGCEECGGAAASGGRVFRLLIDDLRLMMEGGAFAEEFFYRRASALLTRNSGKFFPDRYAHVTSSCSDAS
jgi:hypothetical protein